MTAVAEFDNDIQALLRGHGRVAARVGFIGVLGVAKYAYRFLHAHIITRWAARLQTGTYRLIGMPRACSRVFATS